MKILFATAECAPFFKTGGLGDVAGALPQALAAEGHEVAVILPYLTKIPSEFQAAMEDLFYDFIQVGWRRQYVGIKKLVRQGVTYYFVDNEDYFGQRELYGYYDDGERWAFFCQAVVQLLERFDFLPEVIHVNDFHTAMIPFLLKEKWHWVQAYQKIKTLLTIHNIEFQGAMDPQVLPELFGVGMERYTDGTLRMGDAVNFLKAGILYADAVNTVSPTYAEEIQTPAFGWGLDGVLRSVSGKLSGILNGIDYQVYNPADDPYLTDHFSVDDLTGKARLKAQLQKSFGLPQDAQVPLIGIVSRLTEQKGFRLMLSMMDELLGADVQVVLLGTGMPEIENGFRYYEGRYPSKFKADIAFNLRRAQEIYAGCDLFLMPSAFEPCGLSQMIAMHYGTLPIVHEVGGLKDTVEPYSPITKRGAGFSFKDFNPEGLRYAYQQAVNLCWQDHETILKMQKQAMTTDFSWEKKATEYLTLYQSLFA